MANDCIFIFEKIWCKDIRNNCEFKYFPAVACCKLTIIHCVWLQKGHQQNEPEFEKLSPSCSSISGASCLSNSVALIFVGNPKKCVATNSHNRSMIFTAFGLMTFKWILNWIVIIPTSDLDILSLFDLPLTFILCVCCTFIKEFALKDCLFNEQLTRQISALLSDSVLRTYRVTQKDVYPWKFQLWLWLKSYLFQITTTHYSVYGRPFTTRVSTISDDF